MGHAKEPDEPTGPNGSTKPLKNGPKGPNEANKPKGATTYSQMEYTTYNILYYILYTI